MLDTSVALKLVQGRPWHHDFEIIPGVSTKGSYNPLGLWQQLKLPDDMTGLSVADVGPSNGYFSFEARRRCARVVAFDYRHKDNSGFGLAQYINGMDDIEHHQINVLKLNPANYGKFDIVLALGLYYHVSDPYLALANCAALSKDRLLIESYCIDTPEIQDQPIMRFISNPLLFPDRGHVNNDPSNFWGFTSTCLRYMVEDMGFKVTELNVTDSRVFIDARRADLEAKKSRSFLAHGDFPAQPRGQNPDDADAWVIF